jgi:hypothetical protein
MPGVVEHLFRHEAGKMVATLTRSSAWNTSRWPRTWCRRRWRGHCGPGRFTACRKIPPPGSCGLRAISRSMSSGASQSGIMGEGEHGKRHNTDSGNISRQGPHTKAKDFKISAAPPPPRRKNRPPCIRQRRWHQPRTARSSRSAKLHCKRCWTRRLASS